MNGEMIEKSRSRVQQTREREVFSESCTDQCWPPVCPDTLTGCMLCNAMEVFIEGCTIDRQIDRLVEHRCSQRLASFVRSFVHSSRDRQDLTYLISADSQ